MVFFSYVLPPNTHILSLQQNGSVVLSLHHRHQGFTALYSLCRNNIFILFFSNQMVNNIFERLTYAFSWADTRKIAIVIVHGMTFEESWSVFVQEVTNSGARFILGGSTVVKSERTSRRITRANNNAI